MEAVQLLVLTSSEYFFSLFLQTREIYSFLFTKKYNTYSSDIWVPIKHIDFETGRRSPECHGRYRIPLLLEYDKVPVKIKR